MKPFILFLSLFFIFHLSFSQVRKAKAAFEKKNYQDALKYYQKADEKGELENSDRVQMGVCAVRTKEYEKALEYIKKVNENTLSAIELQTCGRIYQVNDNYDKGFELLKKAESKGMVDSLNYKSGCEFAKANNEPQKGISTTLIEMNTKGELFGIQYFKDGIVIGATHLFYSYYKNGVADTKIQAFAQNLIYQHREGGVCFTDNFTTIYFTKEEQVSSSRFVMKIIAAKFDGSKWKEEKLFPYNGNKYSCAYPAISPDGKTLVFASDMEGSKGGYDLWICQKVNNEWGRPMNLNSLNTIEDEIYPFIDSKNTLYFSSNGHAGYGGYDIFYTIPKDGRWDKVVNMKKPINSSKNDFGLVLNPKNEDEGLFISNRIEKHDNVFSVKLNTKVISNVTETTTTQTTEIKKDVKVLENTTIKKTPTFKENDTDVSENEGNIEKELLKKYGVSNSDELDEESRREFAKEMTRNLQKAYFKLSDEAQQIAEKQANTKTVATTKKDSTTNTNNVSSTKNVSTNDTKSTTDENIIFKVQLSSTSQPLDKEPVIDKQKSERYFYKGMYRYTIGSYKSIEEAEKMKARALILGYKDAFVAAFDKKTNQRLPNYKIYKK